MSSETSAVLVAVRIRPFSKKEDPMTCTVTVSDSTTVTISDVSAAATTLAGASSSSSLGSGLTGLSSAATGAGRDTIGASGDSALAKLAKEGLARHSYTFDRIFWSVASTVLPLPPSKLMSTSLALSGAASSSSASPFATAESHKMDLGASMRSSVSGVSGIGGGGGGGSSEASAVLRQQQVMTVAQQLPCFHRAPECEDQAGIYAFIGPRLSHAVMSGFNSCIFAYGQTGSGKSYSMMGPAEKLSASTSSSAADELGIMPRLAHDIFEQMRAERLKDESVTFTVEVSFLEIYCEKVRDLLTACNESASHTNSTSTLRVRQHPSRGPYVEGLTHVRVRDAAQVMRCLHVGLRDRSTAETKMNEQSSRSHAIMQVHVTKVTVVPDEATVTTKTRVCKVNMVDLAGSERVTQSGATGDRLEEAKNINLSLSTLGRVIQQLSEKQTGKHVVPSYRDSVLTWLLSDSLGGNSKTIMLATIAPSAYCYHQTLNTLRFAGVAKKVINVATVNEDQHFQQLVTELRQQIVRLTLQLEGGKASQVHLEAIKHLKEEKEVLLAQNDVLRVKTANMMDSADVQALRRRNVELEDANHQLEQEKLHLQQRLLSSSSSLREDLAKKRQELLTLEDQLGRKEAELAESAAAAGVTGRVGEAGQLAAAGSGGGGGGSAEGLKPSESAALAHAQAELRKLQVQLAREKDETTTHKQKALAATRELAQAKQSEQEAKDGATAARQGREEYQRRWTESQQLASSLQKRLDTTLDLLDTAQTDLSVLRSDTVTEAAKTRAMESARESALAAQLEQTRQDYLDEKQANVQLLMRVSHIEQDRSQLKRQEAAMQADIHELEQLLLEETESAERHYTRMRYHRALNELLQYMVRTLQHELRTTSGHLAAATAPTRRTSWGTFASGTPQASFALGSSMNGSPRGTSNWDDAASMNTPQSVALGCGGANAMDSLAASLSVQNTAFTNELFYAQLEYECFCEESHQRGLLVQDCLASSNRLWAQKARLHQVHASHEAEQRREVLDRLQVLQDEATFYKHKVRSLEDAMREAEAEQAETMHAVEANELARLTLTRQLHASEEAKGAAEREVQLLVERLAAAETTKDDLEARLREYALAAGEDDADSEVGGGDVEVTTSLRRTGGSQAREDRLSTLAAQCDAYREELGLLRAQQDRQTASRDTQEASAERDKTVLELEVRHLLEAKQKLTDELDATSREQSQRVGQQQRMIDTLRAALEEETKMADLCRATSQQAEAARHGMEAALSAARANGDELAAQKAALEERYHALETDVTDLRQHYGGVERQLMELQAREPELYLLLEKGAAEDSVAWIGKVRQEKANLQKQKLEARRMNSELLQHVRQRTTHLRDVQRQIWDLPSSTPTASPSALSTAHSSASTPLARSTHGNVEFAAQRQLDLDQRSLVSPSSTAHSTMTSPNSKDKPRSTGE